MKKAEMKGLFLGTHLRFVSRPRGTTPSGRLVAAAAEESKEMEKEIDEVEVERECSVNRFFVVFIGARIADDVELFDLLRVVRR